MEHEKHKGKKMMKMPTKGMHDMDGKPMKNSDMKPKHKLAKRKK